jgi:hypothetical protein
LPTIDLSTPPPTPTDTLDALPRRVALTLAELRLVADRAGGAPLPFEVSSPGDAPAIEDRLGRSPGTSQDDAYLAALDTLHDPEDSLGRRGLLTDGSVDDGLLGAVGLLATPEIAVDIDIVAGAVQAKAWHRQSGRAVATLATVDGIVFELAWFPTVQWPGELARVAVLPEDLSTADSAVPDAVTLPYELGDAAAEALVAARADLLPVLAAQYAGEVLDEAGKPLAETEVVSIVTALSSEARGRLRALVADVSGETTTVVGVVSWTLLADGWHAVRPQQSEDGDLRVHVRRVDAVDLGSELAPVLAAVTS